MAQRAMPTARASIGEVYDPPRDCMNRASLAGTFAMFKFHHDRSTAARTAVASARLPRDGRAFTLVELLVVISIIALLVALLLPALRAAREQARKIQCASQVRQTATALTTYAEDYDGWFPVVYRDRANMFLKTVDGGPSPIRHYFGYDEPGGVNAPLGGLEVLFCPSRDPEIPDAYAHYGNGATGTTYRIVAAVGQLGFTHGWNDPMHAYTDENYEKDGKRAWYGWIDNVASGGYGGSTATPLPRLHLINQTPAPRPASEQPMLSDVLPNADGNAVFYGGHPTWGGGVYRANHPDGVNVAFADGHVSWRRGSEPGHFDDNITYYTGGENGKVRW
ncbi:MAG: type II secretion system protein [Phycisphaeraceae bacterium]